MRLDKYLAHAGLGSRNDVKKIIKEGYVKVNGCVIIEPDFKVDEKNDSISVFDNDIYYNENVYIMMNKPKGYVCCADDSLNVFSLLPKNLNLRGIHTVGRLDKDTEGLLIITNDGEYTHKVISPKKMIEKEYYVKLNYCIDMERIKAFYEGVILDDGYKTLPAKYNILDEYTVLLTIYEGKYHQVKRMFELIGNKVVYLKRTRIGKLKLDEKIGPGQIKVLSKEEALLVFN